jgi:glycosyltransferase involved in cell wall biosynthesis
MNISVVILTYNSEETIAATLQSVSRVSNDVHVVDSFSSDTTVGIVRQHGANLIQHPFENYGIQRNWAIDNLPLMHEWELHLDADERLSNELVDQINSLRDASPGEVNGYYVPRLVHFMGRAIRHGGMFPIWHMRLFQRGKGRCEDRQYDQHFYVNGRTSRLEGAMIDDMRMSLDEWVSRHNRWADAEIREILGDETTGRIQADILGSPVQKKRLFRNFYNNFPLFVRPFLLFVYRYFFRLGFLDGKEGLIFFVLQTFWYRFLIDAKLFEKLTAEKRR